MRALPQAEVSSIDADSKSRHHSWINSNSSSREVMILTFSWCALQCRVSWPPRVAPQALPGLTTQLSCQSILVLTTACLPQIHSATLESGVLSDPKVLDQLRAFKSDKRVRLGLSLSGVKQADTLRVALAVPLTAGADPSSGRLFDCVQVVFLFAFPQCCWHSRCSEMFFVRVSPV